MNLIMTCTAIAAAILFGGCESPVIAPAYAGVGDARGSVLALSSQEEEFPAFTRIADVTPSGVAVDRAGNVYISVRQGQAGLIWKFNPAGERTDYVANVGTGTIYGLRMADGRLYAAMANGADQGIYAMGADGGAHRLPGTERIRFANGIAFDQKGVMYISESASMDSPPGFGLGGIWRIAPGGEPSIWLRHALLTGTGAVLGAPVGANGVGVYHGDLYVANTDRNLIVRIPVLPDGSPGEPETWARLQEVSGSPLAGSRFPLMPDDIAFDAPGNLYVVVVSRNAVVRIRREDRSQETIALLAPSTEHPVQRALFDTPASLAFGTSVGERHSLFVTSLGWMERFVPGPQWPGAGLVRVFVDLPGRPVQ